MTPPYRMLDDATGDVATGPNGEKWENIDIPVGHKMELFDTTDNNSPWPRVSPSEIVRTADGVDPGPDPGPEPPEPTEGAIQVGPSHPLKTIKAGIDAARDGGTVEVEAATYTNDFSTIAKRLTIRGLRSPEGMGSERPKLVATNQPSNGKGIFVTQKDVTVENLEFSGCKVSDLNGAGIRYEGGNLVVTNCLFHDNQMGILASASGDGTITITGTEFNHNGAPGSNAHNCYINQVAHVIVDGCYSHDNITGHQFKSRAKKTTIRNSRFEDGTNGQGYNVDLPECGIVLIENCTMQQMNDAGNTIMIAYGLEKAPEAGASLTVTACAMVNQHTSNVTMVKNNTNVEAEITSNQVSGIREDQILDGPGNVSGTVYLDETPPFEPGPEPGPEPEPKPPIDPIPPTGEGMDYPTNEAQLRECLLGYAASNIVGMLDPRTNVEISSTIVLPAPGSGVPWGVNGNYGKITYRGSGDDLLRIEGTQGVNNRGLTIRNLVLDGGDGGNMSGGGAAACLRISAPLGDNGPVYRFGIMDVFTSGSVNGLILEGGVYEGELRGLYCENHTGDGIILRHLPASDVAKGPIVSNVLMWHINSSRNYGAGLRTVYSVYLFGGSFILNGGGGVIAPEGIRGAWGCNGENTGGENQCVFDVPWNGYGSVIVGGEASSDGSTHCRKWNGSDWESVGKPLLYYIACDDNVTQEANHCSYYGGGSNPMRVKA